MYALFGKTFLAWLNRYDFFLNKDWYCGLAPDVALQHLYRSLDLLAADKDLLEAFLFDKHCTLFNMSVDVVFFDVTTFYFESQHADSLRDFGYGKDGKIKDAVLRERDYTPITIKDLFGADIKQRIAEKIDLPPGYYLEYGGQFENQERAMKRLISIVPLALIGGVLGLFLTGEYLSVPASVGFIALFGIAVQNGVVLVSIIRQLREEGKPIAEAIVTGGMLRLRPVLMTAFTTILGLIPLLISTGIGSEVQRPLAIVVVFGLISSTFLTLFLIPAIYSWFSDDKVSA